MIKAIAILQELLNYEEEAKAKVEIQEAIAELQTTQAKLETERDKYNTTAANLQISRQKAYDNIAELEAMVQKMKCCENCKAGVECDEGGIYCAKQFEDDFNCDNYSKWQLEDKK